MSKFYKLSCCFFVSLMMLIGSFVFVKAEAVEPPYDATSLSDIHETDKYPYIARFSHGYTNYFYWDTVVISSVPIVIDGGTLYFSGYYATGSKYKSDSKENFTPFKSTSGNVGFGVELSVIQSNHTIKNKDGSDFFTAPFWTDKMFAPVMNLVQKGMMIALGLMIFLVGLGISLDQSGKSFKKFSRS